MAMILTLIILPLSGALLARALRGEAARGFALRLTCALALAISAALFYSVCSSGVIAVCLPRVCLLGLTFKADGFRALYAMIACCMWLFTAMLSKRYFEHYANRERYYFYNLITLTGVIGVFLSDDLYTAFVFFELMSLASYPWVAHDETPGALSAANIYLAIAIIGGMTTLMGIMLMKARVGSLAFDAIRLRAGEPGLTAAAILALTGFLAKAGAFPLHIWLPKAHPVAPAPASALLSGMLTKTGLFGVIVIAVNLFQGSRAFGMCLLIIALITILTGAVLALFANNLKRVLACSSMSQIGYILTGVACSVMTADAGALSMAGAVAHMVNHSALKLALFMAAGVIYMNLHKLELNDIRGFARNKPLLNGAILLGALGLSGVPLFNGYASKTMIHEGLVEFLAAGAPALRALEWVFLFAAGLTFAYMLKIYIAVCVQRHPDPGEQARFDNMKRGYIGARGYIALALSAVAVPILGALPNTLLVGAANISSGFTRQSALGDVRFFGAENLVSGAITLAIGALVYVFAVRKWMYTKSAGYIERWPARLDLEYMLYRPLFERALPACLGWLCRVLARAADAFPRAFNYCCALIARALDMGADALAAIAREIWFIDKHADSRGEPGNALIRAVKRAMDAAHIFRTRLRSPIAPDLREVTDLRYGSEYTNAVSFGLILMTLGIVAALAYVLLPTLI